MGSRKNIQIMKKITLLAIIAAMFLGCHKDDENEIEQPEPEAAEETITLNVDVVLPEAIQKQWQNSIDWATENIAKAQQKQSRKIKLNLRYHDEDKEDLDALGARLATPQPGDDTCHAIIGPYHSSNATSLLRYARRTRLPVVMPTCTSSELQRTNALNTYAWFLTESDITQCEIMVSAAVSMKATDIALIYSDDSYGESFRDWLGYYATEKGIHIAEGSFPYKKGTDINDFLQRTVNAATGKKICMLVALSNAEDYTYVFNKIFDFKLLISYGIDADENIDGDEDEEEDEYEDEDDIFVDDDSTSFDKVKIICLGSDTALDNELLEKGEVSASFKAVCPTAGVNYGYSQAYRARYKTYPLNGDPQIYDALCIIALGAAKQAASPDECLIDGLQVKYDVKPYEATLTDYMRSVVSNDYGVSTQWNADGLALAFSEIAAGREVSVTGAIGALIFDENSHTNILNTNYMLWLPNWDGLILESDLSDRISPILYLTTSGENGGIPTNDIWSLDKLMSQEFNEDYEKHALPDKTDNWAVVISPSTTWSNYRHQADAFAMYQLLKFTGYDDDHIVLIVEDNLYNNANNKFKGQIFVERGDNAIINFDVRQDAVVDYHFSDLTPDDIADIMLGKQSARLPHVISPTNSSNVFFFWSGHGGSKEGPLWGNEDANSYFGTDRIRNIVSQMADKDMYRRMMLAIETCYSGKWGEALLGQPDVLVITAANPYEYSLADIHDKELGVYLSNAFARTFRSEVILNPESTIYDLYRKLFRTTTGSHVSLYNQQQYGSVYEETINEYFDFGFDFDY